MAAALAFAFPLLLLPLLPAASGVPLGLTDTGILGAIGAVQCSTEDTRLEPKLPWTPQEIRHRAPRHVVRVRGH